MAFWKGFEAQQLVELLAVVSSCADENLAVQAAMERVAAALEAEAACLLRERQVQGAVGFGLDLRAALPLTALPLGRGQIELPVLGTCVTAAADLGEGDGTRLVVVRAGSGAFDMEEVSLVRGMARVLGLTRQMLRTLQAQRARERVLEHLYAVQQAISRRVPAPEVLRMVVAAASDCLSAEDAPAGRDIEAGQRTWVTLRMGDEQSREPQTGTTVICAEVREAGSRAGELVAVRRGGCFSSREQADLRTFAEHVTITLTDAHAQRAVRAALHDSLTGLPSRSLLLSTLADEIGDGPHDLALLFIDLDRFKEVNDTLGHAAGDALLCAVADRLRRHVSPCDMVARLGGDEFAVLVRGGTDERDLVELGGALISALSEPVWTSDGPAVVGASVGIAVTGSWPEDHATLLRRADRAMYEAKRSGRGRCAVARGGGIPVLLPSHGVPAGS